MSIIWSPAISMNWGWAKGFTRSHPRLFRDGVNVGLGSDVPKFGLDTAAMVAYLLSREQGDPEPLLAEEVFEMATLGSARAMGLDARIGSLEPGKLADVVVRTTELPEFQPGHYPVQNLLLASRGKSVDTVLVDGQVVVAPATRPGWTSRPPTGPPGRRPTGWPGRSASRPTAAGRSWPDRASCDRRVTWVIAGECGRKNLVTCTVLGQDGRREC